MSEFARAKEEDGGWRMHVNGKPVGDLHANQADAVGKFLEGKRVEVRAKPELEKVAAAVQDVEKEVTP